MKHAFGFSYHLLYICGYNKAFTVEMFPSRSQGKSPVVFF